MCGFAGFLAFAANPLAREERLAILAAMGQAIAHRGPDDHQIYDDGVLSLVFRRLAIVDTAGGRQPIFNEDRSRLLVCNGEIYNHRELHDVLSAGHDFASASDSEAILHGHEEWGIEVLPRLRGMFALAIWDVGQRQLLLARDRLGIKPLYVCELPDGLLFGSELKALLCHPRCPRGLDWEAVGRRQLSAVATDTYVKGIDFVPGGGYLRAAQGGSVDSGRYWRLGEHLATAPFGLDGQRYASEYARLLEASAVEHLQGEWPLAITLSGGIDSSLLAALVAGHKASIPCFTIVERSTYLAGDVAAARGVAEALGFPWHPVLFDYRTLVDDFDFKLARLEELVWMMESPLFDIEWVIKEGLVATAREGYPDLKVLILGQGADEFAGGYSLRQDRYHASWDAYLADEIDPLLRQHYPGLGREAWRWQEHDDARCSAGMLGSYHQAMQLMVRQLQHHNLWHEDRTSSLHGMEARVPFLDHRIVELLASVPAALHRELFWNKRIVRDCLGRCLPTYDIGRPKVAFCSTDDSRSIDIVIHGMALRLAADFREKYVESDDYPLDRKHACELIDRVVARAPGFYADSSCLLNLMTTVIFSRLCSQGSGPAGASYRPPLLDLAAAADWGAIDQGFRAQPALSGRWAADARPALSAGAAISKSVEADGSQSFELLHQEQVVARIGVPREAAWVGEFLERLSAGDNGRYSIEEWGRELNVTAEALCGGLDILLQCGFVALPLPPAPGGGHGAQSAGSGKSSRGALAGRIGSLIPQRILGRWPKAASWLGSP